MEFLEIRVIYIEQKWLNAHIPFFSVQYSVTDTSTSERERDLEAAGTTDASDFQDTK